MRCPKIEEKLTKRLTFESIKEQVIFCAFLHDVTRSLPHDFVQTSWAPDNEELFLVSSWKRLSLNKLLRQSPTRGVRHIYIETSHTKVYKHRIFTTFFVFPRSFVVRFFYYLIKSLGMNVGFTYNSLCWNRSRRSWIMRRSIQHRRSNFFFLSWQEIFFFFFALQIFCLKWKACESLLILTRLEGTDS